MQNFYFTCNVFTTGLIFVIGFVSLNWLIVALLK